MLSFKLLRQARKLTARYPHDIISVYSMDSACRYTSPAHTILLGYTQKESIGQPWTQFVAPEDRSHANLAGNDALFHGRSIEFTFQARTKRGDRVSMRGVAWVQVDTATRQPYLFFHGIHRPVAKGAFLIHGFSMQRTAASPAFAALRAMLVSKGYYAYACDIPWKRRTVSRFADEFLAFYEAHRAKVNLIIGGSFGAVVALKVAPVAKPDSLVLCSLSAFFSENLPSYPKGYLTRRFGQNRINDLTQISARSLASAVGEAKIPTILTFGEKEKKDHPELVAQVKATAKAIPGSQLHEIPGAGHRMREPEYVAGLGQIIA